jgi:hypothetical protein
MRNSVKIINVAKDFSKNPSGRYLADGSSSGESFLKYKLIPALDTFSKVVIDFNGVRGYGSSFLEEAFGGLIRVKHMSMIDFTKKIEIVSDDPFLWPEIELYLNDAIEENKMDS